MADLLPGIPSVPGDETSWSSFVDQFETLKKGDAPISLTEWDTGTAKPSVSAGSAIEIAGATYRFPSEESIDDEAGLAAGTIYVVVVTNDPGPDEATPYFTDTPPIWRDDLHGWYDSTGENRYTGHLMQWNGASVYYQKSDMYVKATPTLNIENNLNVGALSRLYQIITDRSGNTGSNSNYGIRWTRFSGTLEGDGSLDVPHDIPAINLGGIIATPWSVFKSNISYAMPYGGTGILSITATNLQISTSATYANGEVRGMIIFGEYVGA